MIAQDAGIGLTVHREIVIMSNYSDPAHAARPDLEIAAHTSSHFDLSNFCNPMDVSPSSLANIFSCNNGLREPCD